jgi:predicted transcriptional regulator
MASVPVRIPTDTHARLRDIAKIRNDTIGHVITQMVAEIDEQRFWEEFRESAAWIRADPVAWREMQEEQRIYDGSFSDGLEPETWPDK